MAKLWSLLCVGFFVNLACLTRYAYGEMNAKCMDYAKHIHHHHKTEAYKTYDEPQGVWVSSRCEIVRGEGKALTHGKYIYRRFVFESGKWHGQIHHYSDSWCTKPSFTVRFEGDYALHRLNSSSAYTISSPASFTFTKIKYISPHLDDVKKFFDFMMAKCIDALPAQYNMKEGNRIDLSTLLNKEISIDDYVLRKKHCRFYLALHPYSFKKMRLVYDSNRNTKYSTLYFGDIPEFTVPKMHSYQPLYFQYGLARLNRPWCNICKLTDKEDKPPILPKPTEKNNLKGEWVTETCTASDESVYNTIQFSFNDGKFSLYHVIFADQNCRRKSYAYKVGGKYENFNTDLSIDGIIGVRMTSTWMKLTIYGENILNLVLNSDTCGNSKDWVLGVEQDVTGTKGCANLFHQQLPFIESYLVRAATFGKKRELYINEYNTGLDFNSNLVTCDSVASDIVVKRTTQAPSTTFPAITIPRDDKKIINEHIEKTLREELNKNNNKNDSSPASTVKASLTSLLLSLSVATLVFFV